VGQFAAQRRISSSFREIDRTNSISGGFQRASDRGRLRVAIFSNGVVAINPSIGIQ
jgi:hypothetical protein